MVLAIVVSYSISTSNHNIIWFYRFNSEVVSYSISTSNHNFRSMDHSISALYLIPFLHQTTTLILRLAVRTCCILFHFYIKPQLWDWSCNSFQCCILFHFYIKPQPLDKVNGGFLVVSYSISTSNHNSNEQHLYHCIVVSYSISTSNHNYKYATISVSIVVSYSISTSNHNVN